MASIRQEMLVALSLLEKDQNLFQFSAEQEDLEELSATLEKSQNSKTNRRQLKEKFLKIVQVAQATKASPFQDIHPEWILEALEGESARVMKLVNDKWSGKESKLSPDIAALVWKLVESKLDLPQKTAVQGAFGFPNISWLQEDELKILFQEIGLSEIIKAFQGVPGKIIKPFLARFSLKEATDLRKRIEDAHSHFSEKAQADRAEAQKTILSISMEDKTRDEVLYDIGVIVFMRATCAADATWMPLIYQKFPPALGYPLKRAYLDEQAEDESSVRKSRDRILKIVVELAEKGKIRRYWKAR